MIRGQWSAFAVAVALFATSAQAEDDRRIHAVTVEKTSGIALQDAAKVTIATTGAPDFTLFRLSNPTRIVVDLPGTKVDGARLPERTDKSDLVAAVTAAQYEGQAGGVGRVVLVLRGNVEFDANAFGNSVVVSVKRRGAAAADAATPAPAEKPAPAAAEAKDDKTDIIVLEGAADEPVKKASHFTAIEAKSSGGGTLVQIKTDGEVERYEIQEVDDPPRLVIDLLGVKAKHHVRKNFDAAAVARARVGKHHRKTRVVLDGRAAELPHYDVASTDEGLTILFDGVARKSAGPAVPIRDLSMEQKDGFVRLKLDVDRAVAVRTVKNGPRKKTIALDGVTLAGAQTQLADSVGPVEGARLAAGERDGTLHLELDVNTDVEHSVWQKDGALYWDVREKGGSVQPRAASYATTMASAAHQGTAARRFKGKKINIDLQDADIVNVIRLIGDVSGKNVVVGEDVKGRVTIKLRNVPWDQALSVILRTKSLGQERRGGIIRIAPQQKLDEEQTARLKAAEDREKKQPTTVRLIPVNYAVANELTPQIKELLSDRGRVTFDERTNVIIVEDVRANLDQAEQLVRTLDTQTPLVHIEARMVEATTSFSRALGIQWGGGLFFSQRGGNPTGLIFPNNIGLVGGADDPLLQQQPIAGGFAPTNYAVNLPSESVTSSVGLNLGSIGNYGFLNARLSAAETNGEAHTISAPKVTTLNNKPATIRQGFQIPVTTTTQNQIQTTVINAALQMEVTPHVTADGSILMAVNITNDTPQFNQDSNGIPVINGKAVQTELLVPDGDTAVIGGIFTRTYGEVYNQTPFLGDIPLLGWLFKNYRAQDERGEMLIFITPRIINRTQ